MIRETKLVFSSERQFEEAFYGHRTSTRTTTSGNPFEEAAHFVGGVFLHDGFRLFRNGGTPLLERREGSLVEEVVLQPSGEGHLLHARVHLSHQGLRDVRSRYWTTPARAPIFLAGGNVGELEEPPAWVAWDVAEGGETLERLGHWLRDLVIPWFELFEYPQALRQALYERDVRLLDTINSLEWIIAEFGRREALVYYDEKVRRDDRHWSVEHIERLRALEACYHLGRR